MENTQASSTEISYNKLFVVDTTGQASISYSDREGVLWRSWPLSVNLIDALLAIRNAVKVTVRQLNICHFGLLSTHHVRTKRIKLDGDNKYLVCFAENSATNNMESKHSLMMIPTKFEILMECCEAFRNGVRHEDCAQASSFHDLEMMAKISLYRLLEKETAISLREKCYGCTNNRPSQKDHDYCLMGGYDEEVLYTEVLKRISDHRLHLNTFAVLALGVWGEQNSGAMQENKSSIVESVAHLMSDVDGKALFLGFDYGMLKAKKEENFLSFDPSKLAAVDILLENGAADQYVM